MEDRRDKVHSMTMTATIILIGTMVAACAVDGPADGESHEVAVGDSEQGVPSAESTQDMGVVEMLAGEVGRDATVLGGVGSLRNSFFAAPASTAPQRRATSDSHSAAVQSGFHAPIGRVQTSTRTRPGVLPPGYQLWNLQLNLCNSGHAGCFENGAAVPEAQQVIANWLPDVVTLNEICLSDVRDHLITTMAQTWPGDWVYWAFMPAWDVAQNAPIQCTNGRGEFGNAVMGHVLVDDWAGVEAFGGIYQWQDAQTNEWRSWVCTYAIDNYFGCGTHLAANNGAAAALQCEELLKSIVPSIWSFEDIYRPSVVGGDFNLLFQGNPDIQTCVPANWYRKGDGDVQHWFITSDLSFAFTEEIGMDHTDHPAWLVATVAP